MSFAQNSPQKAVEAESKHFAGLQANSEMGIGGTCL
jgi:hypothetical protein